MPRTLEGVVPIATTRNTTYTDSNLSAQPIHFYQVTALNGAGELSAPSQARQRGHLTQQLAGLGYHEPLAAFDEVRRERDELVARGDGQ